MNKAGFTKTTTSEKNKLDFEKGKENALSLNKKDVKLNLRSQDKCKSTQRNYAKIDVRAKKLPQINSKCKREYTIVKPPTEETLPVQRDSENALPANDIARLLQDAKAREGRIKKRLEVLHEHAKLAIAKTMSGTLEEKKDENKALLDKLNQYQNEICSFKTSMNDVLQVTSEMHNEIKETKDLVANIDNSQVKSSSSLRTKFVEDDDVNLFKPIQLKSELEIMQHNPLLSIALEEAITKGDLSEINENAINRSLELRYGWK